MKYERVILSGIPIFRGDDGRIYTWEPETGRTPTPIGTESADGGLQLDDGWRERLEPKLADWRTAQHPRSRAQLRHIEE